MAGDTTARGYGYAHQKLRRRWALKVKRGGVTCARCQVPIPSGPGIPCPARRDGRICGKLDCGWDLGHDDHDRRVYAGPEHACCNRATFGRVARTEPRPARANWW